MKTLQLSVVRKNRQMKWRVIGISLLMAWAAGMFIMGLYGAESMDATVEDRLENYKFPDAFITLGGFENRTDVANALDALVADGTVDAYQLRISLQGHYWDDDGVRYPAELLGVEEAQPEDINRLDLERGSAFSAFNETVVQKGMEDQGLDLGKKASFTVLGQELELDVTGIGGSTEFLMAGDVSFGGFSMPGGVAVAFLPLEQLQALNYQSSPIGDKVNSIAVLTDDVDAVLDALDAFGVSNVVLQEDHPSIIFLTANADEWRLILPVLAGMFLFVGGFAILMVFQRVVQNDTRFIGVLMAMGYDHREIIRAYLSFGLLIATISALLSVVLGVLLSYGMIVGLFESVLGDIGIVMPVVLTPFILGIAVCYLFVLAALVWPLMKLRDLTPSEALEHHEESRIFTFARKRSKRSKLFTLGLRNTVRRPKQTFATILVIGLAVGVTGSWMVVGDSALTYISGMTEDGNWDVEVNFAGTFPDTAVNETMLGLPAGSAEKVMPFKVLLGELSHDGASESAYITASDHLEDIREFRVLDGELDPSGANLAYVLADEMGLEVGDEVVLRVGAVDVTLEVTSIVHSLIESGVYTSLDALAGVPGNDMVNGAFIQLADGHDEDAVRDALYGNEALTTVIFMTDTIEAMDELIAMMMDVFNGFMFLNGFIAFIIAAATVTIIAAERDLEYATLKSLGVNRRELAKPILLEMGILTTASVLVALPIAYLFSQYLGSLYHRTSMYFPVELSAYSLAFTVVVGLVFVMAAAIVPVKHAWDVDIEKMIRERTSG